MRQSDTMPPPSVHYPQTDVMKVVLLAGGFGTRISEESFLRPKPMIEIGGRPMLWHIMKTYAAHGFNDFIICCGYKAYCIKEYFANYYLHNCDITFDFRYGENTMAIHSNATEPWKVTLIDTGLETMTGGRVGRIRPYVGDEPFILTYGDGVSNIDIRALLAFHKKHGKAATLTTVKPDGRFGILDMEGDQIRAFREKDQSDTGWINAGFMIFESKIFEYIDGDTTVLERYPLETLAAAGELMAYKHAGFWQCMDTKRDKDRLESLWQSGEAPWEIW